MKKTQLHHFVIASHSILMILLALLLTSMHLNAQHIQGTAPTLTPAGGMGIDGDVYSNSPTTGIGDWYIGTNSGSGGSIFDNLLDPYDPLMTFEQVDSWFGKDPTGFPGSNKINQNPSTYLWGTTNVLDKNQIHNAKTHFAHDASGDLWIFFMADRKVTNGDSYIDFEILQKALIAEDDGTFTTHGLDGGRTENDLLITIKFGQGGTQAEALIYRWQPVGSGFEYIQQTTGLTGNILITENPAPITIPYEAFGNYSYVTNQWAEGAANLTNILGNADPCYAISTLFVRTRTSGESSQSELSDFPGFPIQLHLGLDDLATICPDPVLLPACSSSSEILAAYNAWVEDFSYTGGIGTVSTNIALIPSLPADIECGGTIEFTYEVTDQCYTEPLSCSSSFTVTADEVPPTANNPAPVNVQCSVDVPLPDIAVVTDEYDNCGTPVVAWVSDVSDESSCPEVITRTYSITDYCDNQILVYQTITIEDTQAPIFDTPPDDIAYQCIEDVPAAGNLGWTDNCDGSGEVLGTDLSDGNTCPETITRTWSYTDVCGNPASVSQFITVMDTEAPVFAEPPADAAYQCIDEVPLPDILGWTDNCDGFGEVMGFDNSIPSTLCNLTITRTWSYTDVCGNPASVSQIIKVNDTQAPVFADPPADAAYQCIEDVPAPGMLGWTDNCDDFGEVLGTDASDGNTCPEIITRTWSYTDVCGNPASVSQVITVMDTEAPVFAVPPADAAYQCIDEVPLPGMLGWTDNCDGFGEVLGTDASDGNTCPEIITRTWSYTDVCGNPASVSQVITVIDTEAPVFAEPPADAAYQCIDEVPLPDMLGWTDNCDGFGEVMGFDDSFRSTPCNLTITRTWSYTDVCGNPASVSQIITVNDTQAPVFAEPPADAAYQCIEDVPAPGMLGWTDNCDDFGEVLGVDQSDGNTCPEIITRTWSYTDVCGNPASVSQVITVNDTQAPVFDTPPDDIAYQCIEDVPAPGMLGWTDNCDDFGEVLGTDASDGNTCPEIITRTWSYTDVCGNPASVSQVITVMDTEAPVFAEPPADDAYQCIDDVPAPGLLAWTDNCDGIGEVYGYDDSYRNGNACNQIITRTWSYTDMCGNPASVSQVITVNDTQAPVFDTPPEDIAYQCIEDVPAPGMLGWTDNCDDFGEVLGTDASDGNTCPEIITRTWSYTDLCGNPASVSQTITVMDTEAPVFAEPPADAAYQCIGDVPPAGNLGWTDNCEGFGEVLGTDASDGNTCPEIITRTWSYTDVCGNPASVSQVITVIDTEAPVFAEPPADAAYQCIDEVPLPDMLGWTDNCDGFGEVMGFDDSFRSTPCNLTITRTWSYTDVCGNPASVSQIITVNDTQAPVFAEPPADAAYQCIEDVPAPGMLGWTDNCDDFGEVLGVDQSDGNTCPEIITRTWSYTDVCGNPASVSQVITVNDTQAPIFDTPPDDIGYQCIEDVPAPGMLGWTDNCDDLGEVLGTDASDGNTCPEIITRTWSYTDICGNPASVSQVITVMDTEAPVFAEPPADAAYQCIGDVPPAGILGWTDNCDGFGEVLGTDASDGNTCPEIITRTWSYTDVCGNPASVSQVITVIDTEAPVFAEPPADAAYQCIDEVPLPDMLGWTDNCDGFGEVMGFDDSFRSTPCNLTITRTWSYTDVCGNPASVSQIITVNDTQAPVFAEPPADAAYQCVEDVPAPGMLGWTDNCDDFGEVLGVDQSDGNTCPEIITRTWSYTDVCGNPASVSQTITVNDEIPPVFTSCPSNPIDLGMNPQNLPNEYMAMEDAGIATDDCGISYQAIGGDITGDCIKSQVWTVTATDICVNIATCYVTYTWTIPCDLECSLTQGFYGTPGGTYCGWTTEDLLTSLLQTDLVVGRLDLGKSYKIINVNSNPGSIQCLYDILPGGGPSKALNKNYVCGDLMGPQGLKNTLLSQTIALGLNLRLPESDLGSFVFTSRYFATLDATSCDEETAQPIAGTEQYYTLPLSIMTLGGGNPTVLNIYQAANNALAGLGGSLNDLAAAVGMINLAFDNCKFVYFGQPPVNAPSGGGTNTFTTIAESEQITMSIAPNPFKEQVEIKYMVPSDTKVILEVYNLQGVKVATLYDGNAIAGLEYTHLYAPIKNRSEQVFLIVMKTMYGVTTKQIISVH